MMLPGRRMTFQLTPLLDLLLIVIFAQYMDVEQTSRDSHERLARRQQEMELKLVAQAEELRQRMDAEHARRLQEAQQQRTRFEQAWRDIVQQQERLSELLSELFALPEDAVRKLLAISPQGQPPSVEQTAELRRTLKQLQATKGRELLRMLLTYQEMRKRVDVWEVYVTADGFIEFDNGEAVRRFAAETTDEIANGLLQAYKSFPEPRTLVILLFSYGDASAGARQRAQAALPVAVARMREDSGGRHWFEFAVLGFAPDGPSLRAGKR